MTESSESRVLTWVKKRLRNVYHLLADENIFGTLSIERSLDHHALASAEGLTWYFSYSSFVNPWISIWTDHRELAAIFEGNRIGSGIVDFLDGRKYLWGRENQYLPAWEFKTSNGISLLSTKLISGRRRVFGEVEIKNTGERFPEALLLCLLGGYLLTLPETSRKV